MKTADPREQIEARAENTYLDPINNKWRTLDLKNPAPGIYAGVSMFDYLRIEAVSRSLLHRFNQHPARVLEETSHIASSIFGHQYHAFILQPDLFREMYAEGPAERRSKADKEWYNELVASRGGEEYVYRPKDLELMKRMKLSMIENFPRTTRLLINDQPSELTVIFKLDEFPEVVYKIRLDKANLDLEVESNIADLKTCLNALATKFRWSIRDYSYDMQAGLYTLGCSRTPGLEKLQRFIIAAQEKDPFPFLCQNYDMARHIGSGVVTVYETTERLIKWLNSGAKIDDSITVIEPFGD